MIENNRSRMLAQILGYRRFLTWFLYDVFRHFGRSLVWVVIASVVGSAGYMSAFGLGYLYVKHLESADSIAFAGFELRADDSLLLFIGVLLAIGTVLSLSALAEYLGKRLANNLSWHYLELASRRIVMLTSEHQTLPRSVLDAGGSPQLNALATKHAQTCGIAVRLLAHGLYNLSAFPISLIVLVWIAPLLTAVVAGIGLCSVMLLYRLSIRAAQNRQRLERNAGPSREERYGLLKRALSSASAIQGDDEDIDRVFVVGSTRRFAESFARQRNLLDESVLVSKLAAGLALVVAIGVASLQIEDGRGSWANVLVFLAILQFASTRLLGAARVVTSINRFYPPLRTYYNFVTGFDNRVSTDAEGFDVHLVDGTNMSLKGHEVYGFIGPVEPDKIGLQTLYASLRVRGASSDTRRATLWLARHPSQPSAASIGRYFGLAKAVARGQLEAELSFWELDESRCQWLAQHVGQPLTAEVLSEIDFVDSLALCAVAAGDHGTSGIVVDQVALASVEASRIQPVMERLAQQFPLVIVASTPDVPFDAYRPRLVIVSDGEGVLAVLDGNQLEGSAEMERVRQIARSRRSRAESAMMLDDEEF